MRRLGNKHQTIDEFLKDDCGSLPEDHPHIRLYWDVAPIWRGPLKDFYAEVVAETFDCGFASGYESGLVTAVLLPEWAVGCYRSIRQYYLAHGHAPEDLEDWQRHAEETAATMPVEMHD